MTNYVILKPIEPPHACFLWEAIQWRAFGSFPIAYWNSDGRDYRESPEDGEYFCPPIPDDNRTLTYLSEKQTAMAGLGPDPSYIAMENDQYYSDLGHYDHMIKLLSNPRNDDPELRQELADQVVTYRKERAEAVEFLAVYKEWRQDHDAYIDQFQTELLLALRRGDLVAYGRKMPHRQQSKCEKIFDSKGFWTADIEPTPISPEGWVSKYVNWLEGSLKTPADYFVWVTITIEDLLKIFPPSKLVPENILMSVGDSYAIAENAVTIDKSHGNSRRGRPPLPWQDFYVEVARHYRDGTMPDKKEAAIQFFMDWFKVAKGLGASRSSVGEKLKPFFDALKAEKI